MTILSAYNKKIALKNKTILFFANCYFFSVSFMYTLCVLPIGYILLVLHKIFPKKISSKTIRIFSYTYGKYFWYVNRVLFPIEMSDKDVAKKNTPCVIIANHQSSLDLVLLGTQSESNFVYYVKSWPFKAFFFFAPLMRAGEYINIDAYSQENTEEKCLELLKTGTSIVIFPEGKRTRDGKLGKFHSGAYSLACKAQVPVVAFVYENSAEALPVHSKIIYPTKIRISHLQTLYPKDFQDYPLPHREMMRYSQKQYNNHLT